MAAQSVRDSEAWEAMLPEAFFGVVDPEEGGPVYCSTTGGEDGDRALMAYLGDEGLRGLLASVDSGGEGACDRLEVVQVQRCLSASFEDRDRLAEEDLTVVRRLGLGFRGRGAWPLFRSLRPGYYPWFLTGREARLLSVVLEQSVAVAERARVEPDLLLPGNEDGVLFRIPRGQGGGWTYERRHVDAPPPPEPPRQSLDETMLERALAGRGRLRRAWEVDIFRMRSPVSDGEVRPYFPRVAMWVEQDTGLILEEEMAEGPDSFPELVLTTVDLIEDMGAPMAIMVQRNYVGDLLEPLTVAADIALLRVGWLEALEAAREILETDVRDLPGEPQDD